MSNILLCGARSFVGSGLADLLNANSYNVDCFSRGAESRKGNIVFGDYLKIHQNKELADFYDVVVNLAVIKDGTRESNIEYIKNLVVLCKEKKVKKLIHFSTIMNYAYSQPTVTEDTPIEILQETVKRGYAEYKIAVDQYLLSVKDSLPFEVIFVRPGYVLAEGVACPFIKRLPFGLTFIKGNKSSRQPVVKREDIHKAVLAIMKIEKNNSVYHFFPNNGMTKYRYAKETVGGIVICMPKWLFRGVPALLCKLHIISPSLFSRFDGMYIESDFISAVTEVKLNMKFQ